MAAINHPVVASRLKSIRATLDLSLDNVAAGTGLEATHIAALEAGDAGPSGDEILILASFYDCDFRQILDDTLPGPDSKTDILFRRYGSSFTPEDRRSVQEFVLLCQIEHRLETALAIDKAAIRIRPEGRLHKDQGATGARMLREALGYLPNQVPRVYDDFRAAGVHVFRRRLANSEISGLYLRDAIAGHCILVNFNDDVYRQRFSAAHEMAHALFDSDQEVTLTYVRGSNRYNKADLQEIRANAFAAQFLMPAAFVAGLHIDNTNSVVHWATQLQVSTMALAIALDVAGKTNAAALARSVRIPADMKDDPEAPSDLTEVQRKRRRALLERGLSDHYVFVCFESHYRGHISTGRLLECLRVRADELQEVARLYGRNLAYDV